MPVQPVSEHNRFDQKKMGETPILF